MTRNLRILAVAGLIAGGVLGMAGSMVTSSAVRQICWGIDGTGVIVATLILAVVFLRAGKLELAAGFLVYALGEGVMLGGTATSLEASVAAFAAGTALWSAGLAMTSAPREFAIWCRLAGLVGAVLFGIVSLTIFSGRPLTPIAQPLPSFAYPFLVVTFAGWIWAIVKRGADLGIDVHASRAEAAVTGR